ncbi:alpha-amylase [Neurospora intermedia]|uniref:alpha-amylase n=1 Tax=Neurospora intermedia TaxID=5142 RepID=A0ABR3DNG1_NEUIN
MRPERQLSVVLGLLLSAAVQVGALTSSEWRRQSIYQVVTDRFARSDLSTSAPCDTSQQVYCGGSWQGLISKLDYIQGMGFTAVWISPIVKQIDGVTKDGSSYHGYWASDIWSLNPSFGTADNLKGLSKALHDRGMYLMVDVVTNHMAYLGCRSCINYQGLNPFSSQSYYHSPCTINYDNQTSIETCWQGSDIVSLPDLKTETDDVRKIWHDWVSKIVSTYSIDGLRIDSVKHVEKSFWPGFESAAGVFAIGEVFQGDPAYLAPYQSYISGVLDYASYYWIVNAFQSTSGNITALANGMNILKAAAIDLSLYGSFLENHDQARFAHKTSDMVLAKNAIAFTMLKDGIPIIYQGQEQHYAGSDTPYNREALWLSGFSTNSELYTWIKRLNQLRTHVIKKDDGYLTYRAWPIYSDSHTIAMRKGSSNKQVVGVFTNVGASSSTAVTLSALASGFSADEPVTDVVSCDSFITDSGGSITITLSGGLPRILYSTMLLDGSDICSSRSAPTSTTSTDSGVPTSISSAASTSCTATAVPITFEALVSTSYGETIKLLGNTTALGSWNTANAVTLSASKYTSSNPLWYVSFDLAPRNVILYKFIKINSSGTVSWESDPNHKYTVPCAAATVTSTWRK